jgi:sterol desaturase/sphingolipid hydroxylase (fatty acid hydroxylase superfamily)
LICDVNLGFELHRVGRSLLRLRNHLTVNKMSIAGILFRIVATVYAIKSIINRVEGFSTTSTTQAYQQILCPRCPKVADLRVNNQILFRPLYESSPATTALLNSQALLLSQNWFVERWSNVDEVSKWRFGALSLVSTVLLNQRWIDQQLIKFWQFLMTSQTSLFARAFRTDSYEWCLAIFAFTVFIGWFGNADDQVHNYNVQGKTHPWRKYRLQDRYIADKYRRQYQMNKVDNSVDMSSSTNFDVKQSPWHFGSLKFELWVYALPLLLWDILAPRRHRRLATFAAPTTLQIMKDVTGALLLYDFLFFCGHFVLHKVPFLYRAVHKKHHTIEEVRACDQVRLSLGEEVLDVGFSIVALNALSVHPLSRSMYNIIIVFLLTELHSGFDFPWTPQNVIPFGIATGSRRHHYHHRFGHHYYQKFFFTFDRLFGFFQKDDGTLKGDCVRRDAFVPLSWKTA